MGQLWGTDRRVVVGAQRTWTEVCSVFSAWQGLDPLREGRPELVCIRPIRLIANFPFDLVNGGGVTVGRIPASSGCGRLYLVDAQILA